MFGVSEQTVYGDTLTDKRTRFPLTMAVPSARHHATEGSGIPDTEQLKRTDCPTRHRLGRSLAVNCGADVSCGLSRLNEA
jgi:hypothetical protein